MISNSVKLIHITPSAEKYIVYCARVSNPNNQINMNTSSKLLNYLITHKHFSPYEMVNMALEIKTSRIIAAQILRHRSFSFQEFSQRYAEAQQFLITKPRRQDSKNKQNSIDDLSSETKEWYDQQQYQIDILTRNIYSEGLKKGIAKECMRNILPLSTGTTLIMNGSIRSWIHYLQVRTDISTQLEHRDIALQCRDIFSFLLPETAKALEWEQNLNKEMIEICKGVSF